MTKVVSKPGPLLPTELELWRHRSAVLNRASMTILSGSSVTLGEYLAVVLLPLWETIHTAFQDAYAKGKLEMKAPDWAALLHPSYLTCEDLEESLPLVTTPGWFEAQPTLADVDSEWREFQNELVGLNLYGYPGVSGRVEKPDWVWLAVLDSLGLVVETARGVGCSTEELVKTWWAMPPESVARVAAEIVQSRPSDVELNTQFEGQPIIPSGITLGDKSVAINLGLPAFIQHAQQKWAHKLLPSETVDELVRLGMAEVRPGPDGKPMCSPTKISVSLPSWLPLQSEKDWRTHCRKVLNKRLDEHVRSVKDNLGNLKQFAKKTTKLEFENHSRWLTKYQFTGMGYEEIARAEKLLGDQPRVKVHNGVSRLAKLIELPLRAC